MSNNKKFFRRDFKHAKKEEVSAPRIQLEPLVCSLCGESIKEPASSIAMPATGEPAHFDCVLKEIGKDEKLQEGEIISYIGGGNFAVIKQLSPNPKDFKIIKKIEFENKETIGIWRKKMTYK